MDFLPFLSKTPEELQKMLDHVEFLHHQTPGNSLRNHVDTLRKIIEIAKDPERKKKYIELREAQHRLEAELSDVTVELRKWHEETELSEHFTL